MKLLIVTQTVDSEDSILGFFVRWIEEFAQHAEQVEVICLKEGRHALPANVRVHSLGKPCSAEATQCTGAYLMLRFRYVYNFYRYIWKLRHDHDAVLVHMNPVYVILGGFLWRLWGKHIALWYTHKNVDLKLRIATLFVRDIFTASKESFRLSSAKLHVMGHGIDTNFFSPGDESNRTSAVLSAGRLSPTKRHDLVISAAAHFPNEVWIVGEGPERQNLETLATQLSLTSRVRFLGAQTQEGLRQEYRKAGVFMHVSETGSLDKVVLEALSCGLPVVTTAATLSDLPVTIVPATPEGLAEAVLAVRQTDAETLARYVREHHSLSRLIPAILGVMETL